jgi:hypothetical protein
MLSINQNTDLVGWLGQKDWGFVTLPLLHNSPNVTGYATTNFHTPTFGKLPEILITYKKVSGSWQNQLQRNKMR